MKNVLVTGGSRGIGAAVAAAFARAGFSVWINYSKSDEQARDTAEKIGARTIRADVSDYGAVREMLDRTGELDVLVNNAGISCYGLFDAVKPETAEMVMRVNALGAMNCARLALPPMLRRKNGRIINISSVWGQLGASCEVDYSASKAAVIGFTKALAREVAPSGITVNCICPAAVKTDMLSCFSEEELDGIAADNPMLRLATPQDVAAVALFLASDGASYINGQILGVNGGMC